jgi:Mg2+/Co2+ transporter CorB
MLALAAVVIVGLVLLNAFFSLAETALTAASRARMRSLENDGDEKAARVNRLNENRERMIGAVLLGANVVTISASAFAATLFSQVYGDYGPLISTLVLTPLLLIFGEVLPKSYAITAADKLARAVALPIEWMVKILAPIVTGVQMLVNYALPLLGVKPNAAADANIAEEELRGTVELQEEQGTMESAVAHRLRGALNLRDLTVVDVMVHRRALKMLDVDLPPREVLAQAMASRHTRLPVYQDEPENIVGILHARDLLRTISEVGRDGIVLQDIIRKPWFVQDTTWAEDQLAEFLRRREHFALVVDEYGTLMGLVTLEDIIEEIVGDIRDEKEIPFAGVRQQADGSVHVDGHVPVRDLNRAMNWELPDEEAVTVAGLVIHEAQAIPEPGQTYSFHGYRFHILRRSRNAITALRVERETVSEEADA